MCGALRFPGVVGLQIRGGGSLCQCSRWRPVDCGQWAVRRVGCPLSLQEGKERSGLVTGGMKGDLF